MFIDEASIILKAGHGGPGKVSFAPRFKGGPDGGNGGKGGDLYIKATSDLTALRLYTHTKTIDAPSGQPGSSNKKFGHDGEDKTILLPVGSILTDQDTGEIIELTSPDQTFLVCKGGKGGKGNFELRSSTRTTPMYAQPGLEGQSRHFKISLKLIAQFGLIGLPNAGKSSLLNELTKANVKTANYPFTTLEPNLGVLNQKIIADIPGLIEGASIGKGLGIKFLKHIEKTKVLLHCVSADSENIDQNYQIVRNELTKYNEKLLDKKEIVLITKTDLVDPKTLKSQLTKIKKLNKKVLTVSIHDWDSLELLKKQLHQIS